MAPKGGMAVNSWLYAQLGRHDHPLWKWLGNNECIGGYVDPLTPECLTEKWVIAEISPPVLPHNYEYKVVCPQKWVECVGPIRCTKS